ncbi:MAG: hypothetical protein KAH16_02755 [Candidatus Izimaplasma sp.]|nr:hypothetical protein [Candidatus Izimaplasma bacterium]
MVNKKISGIEILVIMGSLLVLFVAVIDAYRISSLFHGMPMEQSYIYDTTIFGIPLTILLLYIIVFVKYRKQEHARAYIMIRLFPTMLFSLYIIGYLFGLNYEDMRNIGGAFTYELLVPLWIHIVFFVLFMSFNVFLFFKAYVTKSHQRPVDIYSVVLVIFYLVLFSSVITDSARYLGLFNWA